MNANNRQTFWHTDTQHFCVINLGTFRATGTGLLCLISWFHRRNRYSYILSLVTMRTFPGKPDAWIWGPFHWYMLQLPSRAEPNRTEPSRATPPSFFPFTVGALKPCRANKTSAELHPSRSSSTTSFQSWPGAEWSSFQMNAERRTKLKKKKKKREQFWCNFCLSRCWRNTEIWRQVSQVWTWGGDYLTKICSRIEKKTEPTHIMCNKNSPLFTRAFLN